MDIGKHQFRLIGRITRTYRCKLKHLCISVLDTIQPDMFFRHPKLVTGLWYISQKGQIPHFRHPRNIDELLMSNNLKAMNDEESRAIRIQCADKYAVREYIATKGYDCILNECLGVYCKVEDFNLDDLPNQFVLKLTNGSGQVFICKDKKDINQKELITLLNNWMNEASTFGLKTGEWHYSFIKPRIIAEKYLPSLNDTESLIDYKFHCFNGEILGILVCYDRDYGTHTVNYDWYDTEWNLTDGEPDCLHPNQRVIPKPESFEQMLRISKDLSTDIEYVRIDFYEIDGKPVFGEMTFTEGGNIMVYSQWVLDSMYNKLNDAMS